MSVLFLTPFLWQAVSQLGLMGCPFSPGSKKAGYGLNAFRFSAGGETGDDESPAGRTPAKLGLIGFPLVSGGKEAKRRLAGRETM